MRTVPQKALLVLWCLPSGCLIGFFLFGMASDAPLAYLAFGFLPASVLSVISILLSYWIVRGTETIARWVWIAHAWVVFGLVFLVDVTTQTNSGLEASTVMIYVMLISAFPVSIIAIAVMAGAAWLVDHSLSALIGDAAAFSKAGETGFLMLTWLVVVLAGYWQWFMFFPNVVGRIRARRKDVNTH